MRAENGGRAASCRVGRRGNPRSGRDVCHSSPTPDWWQELWRTESGARGWGGRERAQRRSPGTRVLASVLQSGRGTAELPSLEP